MVTFFGRSSYGRRTRPSSRRENPKARVRARSEWEQLNNSTGSLNVALVSLGAACRMSARHVLGRTGFATQTSLPCRDEMHRLPALPYICELS